MRVFGRRGRVLGRRATGGASVPVPIAMKALVWFDPSTNLTLDGSGNASSWVDRILGVDAVQAVATQRPHWLASDPALGNRPGLQFNHAASQWLRAPAGSIPGAFAAAYTTYCTANHSVAAVQYLWGMRDSAVATAWIGAYADTINRPAAIERNDAGATNTAAVLAGQPPLGTRGWYSSLGGSVQNLTMRVPGVTGTPVAPIARPLTATAFTIGGRGFGTPFGGSIGHIVLFDRVLSASELATMDAWADSEIS